MVWYVDSDDYPGNLQGALDAALNTSKPLMVTGIHDLSEGLVIQNRTMPYILGHGVVI